MASETSIETTKESLETEQAQLNAQLQELDGGSFDDNFADSGQVAAEQGEARVLAASLRDQLEAVETALERLDSGLYGVCDRCQEPISEARLEAMPQASTCIRCA